MMMRPNWTLLLLSTFVLLVGILFGWFLLLWSNNHLTSPQLSVDFHSELPPCGHLKPLGSHQAPDSFDEYVISNSSLFPSPSNFFNNYIRTGRALVFKQLANSMPAFHRWTDDHLSSSYGDLRVTVETRKVEDRTSGQVLNLSLSEFLHIYRNEDVYLVESLPYQMIGDFHLPKSVLCEDLLKVMSDVVLWMSSGGTKSVLHYDEFDNINCVLDGSKQFFLVDKKKSESHIEVTDRNGAYSAVDVDRVDLYEYPGLRNVPWYNVTLEKGDCLFIPYGWFHQVRSYGERSLALNVWFVHLHWLDDRLCSPVDSNDRETTVPFDDLDFCPASECLRAELVGRGNGSDLMSTDLFREIYGSYVDPLLSVDTVFNVLDINRDGRLSLEEMYKPNATFFLELFSKFVRPIELN